MSSVQFGRAHQRNKVN